MTDIARQLVRELPPPAAFGALVHFLGNRYAMGDALEPERARDVVTLVIHDLLIDAYPEFTDQIHPRDFVSLGRSWDNIDIASTVMNELIVSHRRSLELLADSIVGRSLRNTSNRIFLDTSEIPPLLAIAVVVGAEIRNLLPETAAAWIEEIES